MTPQQELLPEQIAEDLPFDRLVDTLEWILEMIREHTDLNPDIISGLE
jgi:hypothetical protein